MIKILLKILPALSPLLIYILWQVFIKKIFNKILAKKYLANKKTPKIIDGEFEDVANNVDSQQASQSSTIFSLCNKNFVIAIYLSLILAILALIISAF